MRPKNIFVPIIIVIITALVVGGGIYWWQQSVLEKAKSEMQQQINEITEEKNELQKQLDELTKEEERYIRVISPNGGESLCLGEDFIIQWESRGVETVLLGVYKERGTHFIGSFPATYNETKESGKGAVSWKVGETRTGMLKEGLVYKIEISSSDEGSQIMDRSDGIFSILRCEE